ncbi:MAG: hypothetical protein ABIW76_16165 [Fibrobacteria bacterium]
MRGLLFRGLAAFSVLATLGVFATCSAPLAKTLLVIPLKIDSVKVKDHSSIRDFYSEALGTSYSGTLKAAKTAEACGDRECAQVLLKEQGGDEAVFGAVRMLGSKYFLSSSIIEADGKVYSQKIQAANVEDFENATKRMADALINHKTLEEVANLDNITESEETKLANRRTSFYSSGGSIGFTQPFGSSYQRYVTDSEGDCSSFNCIETTRLEKNDKVFTLGWNNWFEFKNHLAMEMDVLFYAPIAFGGEANLLYLFGNSDFTPFAGGGLGVHYVFPDQGDMKMNNKQNFGPAANAQAGIIMFRTYNMNLVLRSSYHVVMNDDVDNGLTVDMAIRTKVGGGGGDKYHHTSATTYLAMAIGIAYLIGIIVSAANT